jgi:hypothetical protein
LNAEHHFKTAHGSVQPLPKDAENILKTVKGVIGKAKAGLAKDMKAAGRAPKVKKINKKINKKIKKKVNKQDDEEWSPSIGKKRKNIFGHRIDKKKKVKLTGKKKGTKKRKGNYAAGGAKKKKAKVVMYREDGEVDHKNNSDEDPDW